MTESTGISKVQLSPEAREAYCADTGLSPDMADDLMAAEGAKMEVAWQAYHAAHPAATVQEFARYHLEQTLIEMLADRGLTATRTRQVVRAAMKRHLP